MKNKGFTLVELLAVIVVLAIIAVITVPMILGIVERARKGALKDSAYGLIEAGNVFYTQKLTQGSNIDELKFTMTNGKFILNGTEEELKFKGEKPTSGNLTITPSKSSIRITDGTYCAYKSMENLEVSVTKGNCSNVDEEGVAQEEQKLSNVYPVGSIYMSVNDTNPANLFGGEWERISKGKTLVGVDEEDETFNASEKTGGEKVHTLTTEEMPSHTHSVTVTGGNHTHQMSSSAWYNMPASRNNFNSPSGGGYYYNTVDMGVTVPYVAYSGNLTMTGTSAPTGNGVAHNNMPPYMTVYIWKRVS